MTGEADGVDRSRFSAPVDHATVAESWRERGYSCHAFTDPPGQEWNDFIHSTNELLTVLEGRLELTLNGEKVEVAPGDEVFIPRDVPHSVKNVNGGTTRWLFGYD
ncbi:MAG: cupin domain-containing protein [Alphaproteobacteria bacterium]